MDGERAGESAKRFEAYLDLMGTGLGDARRHQPMSDYCKGLLSSCERKSVEPMAAATAPATTAAQHQSLLHFIGESPWDDAIILKIVRDWVLPTMAANGRIKAWIVDETSFPKYGPHSVGVSHQYCGHLGKQANCQVAVSLTVATAEASLPVAWRLYLPKQWAEDPALRKKTGIPERIQFETKPKIALKQVEWAVAAGIDPGVVLGDVVYGGDLAFRRGVRAVGLDYALAISARALVCTDALEAKPMQAAALAKSLPKRGWRTIGWRDGTNACLSSRFLRVRVRAAGDGTGNDEPVEWLLVEWPKGEKEPVKFWLSTLPADITLEAMVETTMLRWRIERDYLELKQEVGLDHFEGRGWRGFHHHATMCIAAYGFLVSERAAFPPSAAPASAFPKTIGIPQGFRPRGAPAQA